MVFHSVGLIIITINQCVYCNSDEEAPFNRTHNADNFEEVIPPSKKLKETITEEEMSIVDEKAKVGKDYMDVDAEDLEQGDIPEDQWMSEALLDVAYYLRAHKFHDFDRRYTREEEATPEDRNLYARFPEPPLRHYHWEVFKYCSVGLSSCLKYLHSIAMDAYLQRTSDTSILINLQGWTWDDHNETIQAVDAECKRLRDLDWKTAEPFQGPLERFQWRTSASYFMCWYTMQNYTALSYFGEPCDNFANCLDDTFGENNQDWRADDRNAFACARYSFCPDACCPRRHVKYRTECSLTDLAPCWNMTELTTRFCDMTLEYNTDMTSIIYNRWNVTCRCRDEGFVWDSRFGICVDRNECEEGTHSCDVTELCYNTVGGHGCCCGWGYEFDEGTGRCTLSDALGRIMDRVKEPRKQKQIETPNVKPEPISVLKMLGAVYTFVKALFS
ncbi:hypothetical protein M8J75_000535 [Diaphorina citri]|nr:hypothetical protein M8J75_000535 [Diaphorina citri]